MKGSEYVAKFLKAIGSDNIFLVQGGACAFMIDAVGREPDMKLTCFQHEQAAAMAADAVWRVSKRIGATFSTSGPGASNLVTGIACGYYDSIPSLHITGQVNAKEQAQYRGAPVRQAGFQQMDIVSMVKPVCKYAVAVSTHEELRQELKRAVEIAKSGRMGPVLVDVPMDLQNEEMENSELLLPDPAAWAAALTADLNSAVEVIREFIEGADRPLVVFGAGVGLSDSHINLVDWLSRTQIPFVSTWASLNYFPHDMPNYIGHFGVYGNRGGNFAVQNADRILVLGSRLDNRQRSGNPNNFAPNAEILCVDIDQAELDKLDPKKYSGLLLDLRHLPDVLPKLKFARGRNPEWDQYLQSMKDRYFNKDTSSYSVEHGTMSPYQVVQCFHNIMDRDAVLTTDAGANHCWVYQTFYRTNDQEIMTSSGHYAMGYALPASIGSALMFPDRQQLCFNGDGGIQMNIQELQTATEYDLDIKVVVFNNRGLGMIKQFQDTYMGSRYTATDIGPGRPDFEAVARAYKFDYVKITALDQIVPDILAPGRRFIEIEIDPGTTIEPKLEMGRPINDQMPYVSNEEFAEGNRFVKYKRM
jgi:acetolactate synthase-1/2/3 large subunit